MPESHLQLHPNADCIVASGSADMLTLIQLPVACKSTWRAAAEVTGVLLYGRVVARRLALAGSATARRLGSFLSATRHRYLRLCAVAGFLDGGGARVAGPLVAHRRALVVPT